MNKTNKVTKIEDSVSDPTYNGCFNFADGASQSNEYTYDQNGNLTKDLNKKISSIQYNLLILDRKSNLSLYKGSSGDWEMSRVIAFKELRLRATSRFYDPSSGAKVRRFFEITKLCSRNIDFIPLNKREIVA